nr:hypothetical protein GCM10017745_02960 [Saccharothrix mutabilis subsp. capreolus]
MTGQPVEPVEALRHEPHGLPHLVHQAPDAGEGVPLGPDDGPDVQVAVTGQGVVPTQVEVHTGRPPDRSRDAERQGRVPAEHTDPLQPVGNRAGVHCGHCFADAIDPPGGDVLAEPADPVEHEVDPPAGRLLQDGLDGFAPVGGDLAGERGEEDEVRHDPVQLAQQRPQDLGARGDVHAGHALDGEGDGEFVAEGGEPVMAVGEREDLPVVTDLEQLLRAAVQVADEGFGGGDRLVVADGQAEAVRAVRGRVQRAEVHDPVHPQVARPGPDTNGDLHSPMLARRHRSPLPRPPAPDTMLAQATDKSRTPPPRPQPAPAATPPRPQPAPAATRPRRNAPPPQPAAATRARLRSCPPPAPAAARRFPLALPPAGRRHCRSRPLHRALPHRTNPPVCRRAGGAWRWWRRVAAGAGR